MSIGSITVNRERSVLTNPRTGSKVELRSNRATFQLSKDGIAEDVVVRGQNLPATLRLCGVVIDVFQANPWVFRSDDPPDWDRLWADAQSDYERRFVPETWAAVYVNGERVHATLDRAQVIDAIEAQAAGEEISESLLRKVTLAAGSAAEGEVMDVVHDTQMAVMLTDAREYLRCSLLQRLNGKTASLTLSAYHERARVSYRALLFTAANIIEALNITTFSERLRDMVRRGQVDAGITSAQVEAAITRKRELAQSVAAFERAHKVRYRPERPAFLG